MDSAKLAVSEQGASPATRSAAAIPSNIRRTLEESNLPIEVATAIADRLEASQPVGGEAGEVAEQLKGLQQIRFEGCQYGVISPEDAEKAAALIEKLARDRDEARNIVNEITALCMGFLPLDMCYLHPVQAVSNVIGKAGAIQSELSALKSRLDAYKNPPKGFIYGDLDAIKELQEAKARLDAPCEEESPIDEIYKQIGDVRPGSSLEVALYHADEAWGDLYRKWQEAQEKIYVLGTWRCAKCNLRLVATHLDAASGDMSANNEPQQCANGCGPMWRVTEREERQEAQRSFNAEWERAEAAEQRAAEAVARERTFANELTLLRELADHTSPYVNSFGGESNRRMAEIRKQLKAIRARSEGEGSG